MTIGALGTLPAASTADAAHAALTAHTIPVTCCRGRSKGVRSPVGSANSCLAACQSPMPALVPSTALQEDVPGLSGLRPTRGSWP